MKTKIQNLLTIIVIAISTTSCATLFTSSKQSITFESTPPGAKVQVNGIDMGVTPVTIPIRKKLESPTITMKKEGYETRTFELEQSLSTASIFNLANLLGWGIDAASGKIMKYDQKIYNMELEPKK